jgi:hypothetical protein
MRKGALKKTNKYFFIPFSVLFYRFNTHFLSVSYSRVNRTSLGIAKKRKGVENYSHISFSVSVLPGLLLIRRALEHGAKFMVWQYFSFL